MSALSEDCMAVLTHHRHRITDLEATALNIVAGAWAGNTRNTGAETMAAERIISRVRRERAEEQAR